MAKFYSSLDEIKREIQSGEVTVEGLVKDYLTRIRSNAHLNAFNEVFEEEALSRSKTIDARIKAGTAGRLAGMVIGIKDNICYKGHKVSASSKILDGFTSIYSSTIVERLLAEDAVIIGRCNCDEFAMGATNENSYFGPVRNHADHTKVPGGSSG
ncbi:MAG TPA: amidase, partial [Mucilaginibacter sp.]